MESADPSSSVPQIKVVGPLSAFKSFLAARFELERGRSDNLPSMEGLRGYAVFLVFLVHYAALSEPSASAGSATAALVGFLHQAGQIGVDLFFVLSGYLIYGMLRHHAQPFRKFMRRRGRRLYPAFICVVAIYLVLSWALPQENKIPFGFVPAITYIIANILMLPGIFPIVPMITVAWSLSYEVFYYIAIPILIAALNLRVWSARWRVLLFALLAIALVLAIPLIGGRARLAMFISGILLVETIDTGVRLRWPTMFAVIALPLSLLVMAPAFDTNLASRIGILFFSFYALCFGCFTAPSSIVARAFAWSPLRWLGNMSYSYYLIHGLTLKALFLVASKFAPQSLSLFWPLLVPAFAATLIVSAALFLSVERPFSLRVQHRSYLKGASKLV